VGELRQRTDRLQTFPDLEAVEAELNGLMSYPEGSVVACLPAGSGRRVALYAQLLTGEPTGVAPLEEYIVPPASVAQAAADQEWKERMETEIQLLKTQLARLKASLGVED
jgi:uncharacterized protein YceH (UPF0502 family)